MGISGFWEAPVGHWTRWKVSLPLSKENLTSSKDYGTPGGAAW
jgi:hypothetical protein